MNTKVPNINLPMDPFDYRVLMVHKALVGGIKWDDYVDRACMNFPMKIKTYGEVFSFSHPPPMDDPARNVRKVTIRMTDATYAKANRYRDDLGYTWREFLMYPSQKDDIHKIIENWYRSTKVIKLSSLSRDETTEQRQTRLNKDES